MTQKLKATEPESVAEAPPTLVTVVAVATRWTFTLAISGHVMTGHSSGTRTPTFTAGSKSTRVTFC